MLLEDMVQLMERQNVKRLPLVRGEALVGIVARSDLLPLLQASLEMFRSRRPTTIRFGSV